MLLYLKKFTKIILILLLGNFSSKANLIINEIFPAPIHQNIEWVELFNNSNDTIKLLSGFINDAKSTKKLPDIIIPPGFYALLVKDTTLYDKFWNKSDSCLLFEVKLPTLNNDIDIVAIRSNDSSIIDSINYHFNSTKKGFSLERIKPDVFFDFENNWNYSEAPDSSTPGQWNSLSNEKVDIELNYRKNNNQITFEIYSKNKLPAKLTSLTLFIDSNNNGNFEINEQIIDYDLSNEIINDTLLIDFNLSNELKNIETYGDIYFKAYLNATNDKSPDNNSQIFFITNHLPENSIKFNEILFDNDSNMSDFIEIFNLTTKPIFLNNFELFKYNSNNLTKLLQISYPAPIIQPQSLSVIASDSNIMNRFPELKDKQELYISNQPFTLSYSGDILIFKNSNNQPLDSINYSRDWFNNNLSSSKNISIEKINPSLESHLKNSWAYSKSLAGSTPLTKNSSYQEIIFDDDKIITIEPNPFTPLNGNKNNYCLISYVLPFDNSLLNAKIYTQDGILVNNLATNEYTSKEGTLIWDGRNNDGYLMDVGLYILIIEITYKNTINTYKKLIILAN